MKNIIDLLKTHIWKVSTVLFLLLFLSRGCVNNKISNLDKKYSETSAKLDSLHAVVNSMATAKEVRDEMERTMFDYLIYEDDLDKGKASISDIKNKIESND